MAVSSEHALREAELLTLRQISDAINLTNERLGRLDTGVADARERLARMESNSASISELKEEVEALKSDLQQRKGAGILLTWLKDFTPWILGIAVAALAAAGRLHIG